MYRTVHRYSSVVLATRRSVSLRPSIIHCYIYNSAFYIIIIWRLAALFLIVRYSTCTHTHMYVQEYENLAEKIK